MCDPHIHIFQSRAYLYATHDAPGYTEGFCMKDWQIWSSKDLIDWQLDAVIDPKEFYCGSMDQCWAVDAAYRNGTYYLYFSTGDWGVGVAVSEHPAGPFRDVLGHALVDYDTYPQNIQKWDPHVFVDEDGEAYLVVGTCLQKEPWDCYLIARLGEDMIHLAEPLRRIEYVGNPCPEDKPSIHKENGIYYLTHASYYAVSDNVYGPYIHRGHIGFTNDHGSFFTYHNQTYFAAGGMDNPNRYMRASYLVPCHYRENGDIVIEQEIAAYGCGQYDAAWERIEARWYYAAARACKKEKENGAIVTELRDGEYLYFPEILNLEENTRMQICAAGKAHARMWIYEDSPEGKLLGNCDLEGGAEMAGMHEKHLSGKEGIYECTLSCEVGKKALYLLMEGEAELSWFSFDNGKKRCTAQPLFSRRGRGASLSWNVNGANHLILRNLELRGAGLEVYADGGQGKDAELIIDYCCPKADAATVLYINGTEQQSIAFPETEAGFGKLVHQKRVKTMLKPGLNKIGLWTREYQKGKLEIAHLTVETEKSCCKVYPAANGTLFPAGNGCWDGLPQWETEPLAVSGRIVKYLGKPEYGVAIPHVDGGVGGAYGLEIHYCCGEQEGSEYELLVNGKSCSRLHFPFTGGFGMEQMQNLYTEIVLEKGRNNTIQLEKVGDCDQGIFVDAFAVIPVDIERFHQEKAE